MDRWHCDECGCEWYHSLSCPGETIICPNCKSTDIREIDQNYNATSG